MIRPDGRAPDQLRPIQIQRPFIRSAAASCLYTAGQTIVLCTASVEHLVPAWRAGSGKGWVTAEYSMLPGSTRPRKPRERGPKLDGRTTEIQRLIGRSLRAVLQLAALGERTITLDCDVLQADGGTRTASITAAFLTLVDAIATLDRPPGAPTPLVDSVAAVSVGLFDGHPILDLDYQEDAAATVDMNVVMTGRGRYVEVQGTGEEATFSDTELSALLKLSSQGIAALTDRQRAELGDRWPWAGGIASASVD